MAYWKITYGGVPYYVDDISGSIYDATGKPIQGYRAAPDATGTWHIYGPSGLDWVLRSDWNFYDPAGSVMAQVSPRSYSVVPWDPIILKRPGPQQQQQQQQQRQQQQPQQPTYAANTFSEEGLRILRDAISSIGKVRQETQGLFDRLKGVL